jgi:hypothetical protein
VTQERLLHRITTHPWLPLGLKVMGSGPILARSSLSGMIENNTFPSSISAVRPATDPHQKK